MEKSTANDACSNDAADTPDGNTFVDIDNNADNNSTVAHIDTDGMAQQQQQPVAEQSGISAYPLPTALQQRLYAAAATQQDDDAVIGGSNATITPVRLDLLSDALAHLVGNAIQALDAWYFDNNNSSSNNTSVSHVRQHPALAHRLCLRVAADKNNHTLSITDCGVGMTRGDLINSLGIGGRASMLPTVATTVSTIDEVYSATATARLPPDNNYNSPTTDTSDEDDDADEEEQNLANLKKSDSDSDEDDHATADMSKNSQSGDTVGILSDVEDGDNDDALYSTRVYSDPAQKSMPAASALGCTSTDLGGFYAALCALGVGVQIATKSKFDDYYIAEIGMFRSNVNSSKKEDGTTSKLSTNTFEHLSITRPHPEGTPLTVNTKGHERFHNVRGESGTCVKLHLNNKAIAAGFDDEEALTAIILKIVETTQYTVAFSSDKEQAEQIISASAIEQAQWEAWEKEKEELPNADSLQFDALEAATRELQVSRNSSSATRTTTSVRERAKFIPLRLSLDARKMLRLVEASMHCCEYTSNVDQPFKSAARRTHAQLQGVTSIMRGLVIACDYSAGQKLWRDDNFANYKSFFQSMFEIARRHKIMNPEKMRTEYGKLIYLIQDAVSPSVLPHLGFSIKGRIESVYKFLEDRNGLGLLNDPYIETATEEILAGRKSRATIDSEIRKKEKAVLYLKRKYQTSKLSADDIHLCLYSICDNNSFLNSNRVPIDKIIDFLTANFSPDRFEDGYSLSIVKGTDGSRLSHSHERQYYYALQSLTLWRDIVDDMFRLWAMAEDDLLSEGVTYALQDTGQGMQRVQPSPRTYKAMQHILQQVQRKVGHWVGSTMIHLGDHNVPNALSFIDKYTQVPRILGPIVSCIENLERICEKDEGINKLVERGFGGVEKLKKDILYDFFKSAFDGSGADNFYDAGSCIDGRLTSAWNWCSQLPDKPFYMIFKLTGFTGFDGEFK